MRIQCLGGICLLGTSPLTNIIFQHGYSFAPRMILSSMHQPRRYNVRLSNLPCSAGVTLAALPQHNHQPRRRSLMHTLAHRFPEALVLLAIVGVAILSLRLKHMPVRRCPATKTPNNDSISNVNLWGRPSGREITYATVVIAADNSPTARISRTSKQGSEIRPERGRNGWSGWRHTENGEKTIQGQGQRVESQAGQQTTRLVAEEGNKQRATQSNFGNTNGPSPMPSQQTAESQAHSASEQGSEIPSNHADGESNGLNEHNSFRALYGAPPLTWSDEIASTAAAYAALCINDHSKE